MLHVAGMRLEEVRPQHEALAGLCGLAQPRDHARDDAGRGDVLVGIGDALGAVVGPFAKALGDARSAVKKKWRKDSDGVQTRGRQRLEKVWLLGSRFE